MRKTVFLFFLFSLHLSLNSFSQENIALNKTITVSSTAGSNLPSVVNDGLNDKYWSSTFGLDNQWIMIDLGDVYDLTSTKVFWTVASGKNYEIEVSTNNRDWRSVANKTSTDGARTDEFDLIGTNEIRYIRLNLKTRNSALGFAIYEWEIYGTPKIATQIPTVIDINPKNATLLTDFPEELSILSLNNSLIDYNDQPSIFNQLVQSAGKRAVWTKQTRLGQSLLYHYQENDGAEPAARTVVSSKAWTHIILQEQSNKPITNYQGFFESVRLWVDYIKANCPNPNARVILMLNWPYSTSSDYAGDYATLYANYKLIAEELGIMICPAATAFNLVRTTDGDHARLYTDDRHPSPLASYLSACTFYSTFFNSSPIGLTYKLSDISQADATRMQNRAWEAFQSHTDVVNDIEGTIRYKVNILDQFNRPITEPSTLNWSVTGGGSLNNGVFSSNGENGSFTVTVQSGTVQNSANISVIKLEDDYFSEIDNNGDYSQNFDGIGVSATSTLPVGWKVEKRLDAPRTIGSFDSALLQTEQVGGNNISASTKNGIYNFGAGGAATASDRAIGGVSTGIADGTRCVNIYLKLKNSSTKTINSFNIKYDVEKYRKGANTAGFTMQMYYSTDGINWRSAGDNFKTLFDKDITTEGYTSAPGATINVSAKLDKIIRQGDNLYLAWNYSVASGTDAQAAQALALDNVEITKIEDDYFAEISDGSKYLQNFDELSTEAIATLPIGWKIEKRLDAPRIIGSFDSALLQTEQIGGNSISSTTKNGIYNFGAGIPASAIDRAIGGISTGIDGGTRGVNMFLKIRNTGTKGINSLDIKYDVEKYRKGTNPAGFIIQMYYSTDGIIWTSGGDEFRTFFYKDDIIEGYTSAPGLTNNVSANLSKSLEVGEDLYLAWNYSVASGLDAQAAQALAIDNVEISSNTMMTSISSFSDNDISISYSKQVLNIKGNEVGTIIIYSMTGKVLTQFIGSGVYNLSDLGQGIYFVKIEKHNEVFKIIN